MDMSTRLYPLPGGNETKDAFFFTEMDVK